MPNTFSTVYPKSGAGFQVGDGDISDPLMGYQGAPATATVTATLTVAQFLSGILIGDQGSTAAAAYTLPTVASLEATLSNAKLNSTVELVVINIGNTSAEDITMTTNTGWTLVGNMVVVDGTSSANSSSAVFLARKTGDAAWTLYRKA